jgi:phage antirepressor YoqD-like protein
MFELTPTETKQMMSSKEIAELTGKTISHVHRDINSMLDKLADPKLDGIDFIAVLRDNGQISEYFLNHDLTILLVTGYDINARMTVIRRWKELEKQVAVPAVMTLEQLLEHNMKMLQDLSQKVVTLEKTIEDDKPMTNFGKAVASSDATVLIGDWIKALANQSIRMGRNKAFNWFRSNGYLMKNSTMPYQQYIDQGLFEVKETLITTSKGQRITFTTLLTGKGQVYFAQKLGI